MSDKFGTNLQVICNLDETLSIWKSSKGYFWLEKHNSTWSNQFYKSQRDAMLACRELILAINV